MEKITHSGKIFEIVQTEQTDGRVFEVARRAPGVRLIIADNTTKKVLLTKEFRQELHDWDYRLPGGKVFDSLAEFAEWRATGQDILIAATEKAKAEGAEEAGIDIAQLELFAESTLGATVDWNLFVFDVKQWVPRSLGQQLEAGEQIEADNWFSFEEAEEMILSGKMQEERIALILLRWLKTQGV